MLDRVTVLGPIAVEVERERVFWAGELSSRVVTGNPASIHG